jgi:hypothetical protein
MTKGRTAEPKPGRKLLASKVGQLTAPHPSLVQSSLMTCRPVRLPASVEQFAESCTPVRSFLLCLLESFADQPMLVECVAMLIGSDPESFLAGAVSPAPTGNVSPTSFRAACVNAGVVVLPGDRTTADKSHSLVRFLTLLSTGLSPLSHSAEKLLISAICRILEACHHASPNCTVVTLLSSSH